MRTEMHEARPYSIRVVSARKVVFTFDMDEPENENLLDKEVVVRSMAGFMVAHPRFESYTAEYVGKWLVLTCVGVINREHVPHVDMHL